MVLGIVAAVIGCMTTAGVMFLLSRFDPAAGTEKVSIAEAQKLGMFTFPGSMTTYHAQLRGFQDYYLRVRFTIMPSELDGFLAGTKLIFPLSSQTIPSQFTTTGANEPSWWCPTKPPTKFLAGASPLDGTATRFQYILIDQSNPASYEVYLVAHDQ
jgi:hypothetical protein